MKLWRYRHLYVAMPVIGQSPITERESAVKLFAAYILDHYGDTEDSWDSNEIHVVDPDEDVSIDISYDPRRQDCDHYMELGYTMTTAPASAWAKVVPVGVVFAAYDSNP